jgi:all-trans-retinol 13,14-reductase
MSQNVGISYKQTALEERWDAIVIGSGIGGLAAAAMLAKHGGKRVLVLERHYTAGGYTHAFHRPGYEWDVGVHYIGRSGETRRAFDYLTEGRLGWANMPDVYDRFLIGGNSYELPTGVERFRAAMKSYFPTEARAIDRYIEAVQHCIKASRLYYAEKAVPGPIAAIGGGLMRSGFLRWARRTTAEVLSEFTSNRELIGVLTAQWGDYGLPPGQSSFAAHATIVEHYFEGAIYPIGGAAQIAASIEPVIASAGGQIVTSAEAAAVIVEKERAAGVRMADGREFRSPIVISDAGVRNTLGLIREPNDAVRRLRTELDAIPPSMAHLSLYVGIRQTAAELGLNGTNLWISPSPDHDANLERYTKGPSAPFPLVFISFPSAKDPEFEQRHPGRATLEVITTAPYSWFEKWEDTRWKRRGADYDALKSELAARLQAELEKHVSAVAGKIDYAELSTPLSTRNFMNYERGEAYGLSATPARFAVRGLKPQSPIRRLYLTGQDVVSLGVTGALFGGVVCASSILRRNLLSAVSKPLPKPSVGVPVIQELSKLS